MKYFHAQALKALYEIALVYKGLTPQKIMVRLKEQVSLIESDRTRTEEEKEYTIYRLCMRYMSLRDNTVIKYQAFIAYRNDSLLKRKQLITIVVNFLRQLKGIRAFSFFIPHDNFTYCVPVYLIPKISPQRGNAP